MKKGGRGGPKPTSTKGDRTLRAMGVGRQKCCGPSPARKGLGKAGAQGREQAEAYSNTGSDWQRQEREENERGRSRPEPTSTRED